jgi:hypothetical protein
MCLSQTLNPKISKGFGLILGLKQNQYGNFRQDLDPDPKYQQNFGSLVNF